MKKNRSLQEINWSTSPALEWICLWQQRSVIPMRKQWEEICG